MYERNERTPEVYLIVVTPAEITHSKMYNLDMSHAQIEYNKILKEDSLTSLLYQ